MRIIPKFIFVAVKFYVFCADEWFLRCKEWNVGCIPAFLIYLESPCNLRSMKKGAVPLGFVVLGRKYAEFFFE